MSTGQSFLGYNMFAYCGNNPVVYFDHAGTDAVILFDEDFLGHIGILVQDSNGTWWHFYWGADGLDDMILCLFNLPVDAKTWLVEYTGDPTSIDEINKSGQYSTNYEELYYLEGDFSATVDDFDNMSGSYNLYSNNCSQVSLRTLALADTSHKDMLLEASQYMVPSFANRHIRNNKSDCAPVYVN